MKPCDSENLTVQLNPRVVKGMGREETTVVRFNHQNVHYPLVDDFANSILNDRDPRISGKEGYKTNRILKAVEESAKEGKKIII
jgi:predicted dehydrogenase